MLFLQKGCRDGSLVCDLLLQKGCRFVIVLFLTLRSRKDVGMGEYGLRLLTLNTFPFPGGGGRSIYSPPLPPRENYTHTHSDVAPTSASLHPPFASTMPSKVDRIEGIASPSEGLGQGAGMPPARHGKLGVGRDDPCRHHGQHEIALAAGFG